jgi:hypothetical protein
MVMFFPGVLSTTLHFKIKRKLSTYEIMFYFNPGGGNSPQHGASRQTVVSGGVMTAATPLHAAG